MKKPLLAWGLCMALSTVPTALANERVDMDRKQAVLTKQLEFAEQLAAHHGRYKVIRDQYLTSNTGLFQRNTKCFTAIRSWLETWATGLQELTQGNWVERLQDPKFVDFTNKQALALEDLFVQYRELVSFANRGHNLSRELVPLNMQSFLDEAARGFGDDIFLQNYAENLDFYNQQVKSMQNLFSQSVDLLNQSGTEKVLAKLQQLNNGIHANIKMQTSMRKLYFPQLKQQIKLIELMLATERALDPVTSQVVRLYQRGQDESERKADFLAAEATIKELDAIIQEEFVPFEGQAKYDQDRVKQAKALARLHASDLKNLVELHVQSEGGRDEALKSFIKKNSRRAYDICRVKSGKIHPNRHLLDCNLLRKNIMPFTRNLDQIDVKLLEVMAKNLRDVFQGPLNKEAVQ